MTITNADLIAAAEERYDQASLLGDYLATAVSENIDTWAPERLSKHLADRLREAEEKLARAMAALKASDEALIAICEPEVATSKMFYQMYRHAAAITAARSRVAEKEQKSRREVHRSEQP